MIGQFSGVISLNVPTWLAGVGSFPGPAVLSADALAILGFPAEGINQDSDHQRSSWPSF